MTTTNRFLMPGGLAAALTCLVLTACGQPGSTDSGMMPMPDAYMPTGDGGMPDAYVPDSDAGMPDVDAGTDAAAMMCTADMMLNRVSPPCDPDIPETLAPSSDPTSCDATTGAGRVWHCGTNSAVAGRDTDAMGREGLFMPVDGDVSTSTYADTFYLASDGNWYANWKNRMVAGHQGDHVQFVPDPGCTTGTAHRYVGGSDEDDPVSCWAG